MIPSRLLLQRKSLCCAKMPGSCLDDGGEGMAIATGVQGLPAAYLEPISLLWRGRTEGPGIDGSKEPPGLRRWAGAKLSDARMDSSPSRRHTSRIDSLDKRVIRKRAPRRWRRRYWTSLGEGPKPIYCRTWL